MDSGHSISERPEPDLILTFKTIEYVFDDFCSNRNYGKILILPAHNIHQSVINQIQKKMVGVVPLHSQDTDRSGSSTPAPSESDRKLRRMSVTHALPGNSSTKVVPSPAPSQVMVKMHVCV